MSRMEENWMIEYIKKVQKHGNSKCVILSKFEITLLGITGNVKVTIDNQKIIIEAVKAVEEVF